MQPVRWVLTKLKLYRWLFSLSYRSGFTPWDTGITPPELVEVIEGAPSLQAGYALDIGCGSGTNCLYLAQHGWKVTGVDFAGPAIQRARAKARAMGIATPHVQFIQGDATKLAQLGIHEPFALVLDMGCLHSIPAERRSRYVQGVSKLTAPGALFLLYAFGPRQSSHRPVGMDESEVGSLFGDTFIVERVVHGHDRRGGDSAWYWLRRK